MLQLAVVKGHRSHNIAMGRRGGKSVGRSRCSQRRRRRSRCGQIVVMFAVMVVVVMVVVWW